VYSFGILLYLHERSNPHDLHSWWYVLVLVATALHWYAVYTYVRPPSDGCIQTALSLGLATPDSVAAASGDGSNVSAAMQPALAELLSQHAAALQAAGPLSLTAAAETMATAATALGTAAATAASDSKRAMVHATAIFLRQLVDRLEGV
jgi:hypothetical protein